MMRRAKTAFWLALLLLSPGLAEAQEVEFGESHEAPPPSPFVGVESDRHPQGTEPTGEELTCPQVACRCADAGAPASAQLASCREVVCECVDEVRGLNPFAPAAPIQQPTAIAQLEQTDPIELALTTRRQLPAGLDRPVPSTGFQLSDRNLALKLELGFPFFEGELLLRVHDIVQLGAAYRSAYAFSSAGFGSIKVRLWRNERSSIAVSAIGNIGYTHVEERDFDFVVGNNGPFGEILVAFTMRWGRHAFDFLGGMRIGWVKSWECDEGASCPWDMIFNDGQGRVLPTVIADLGWSARFSPRVGYYLACGAHIFVGSDEIPAMVRFRNGVFIEF